jgi:hypothetical protein
MLSIYFQFIAIKFSPSQCVGWEYRTFNSLHFNCFLILQIKKSFSSFHYFRLTCLALTLLKPYSRNSPDIFLPESFESKLFFSLVYHFFFFHLLDRSFVRSRISQSVWRERLTCKVVKKFKLQFLNCFSISEKERDRVITLDPKTWNIRQWFFFDNF